jgi:homoserine dehydrogenase
MQQVNLGIIGAGTVGSGVFHALQLNGNLMASRIGVNVAVRKVAAKSFDEQRPYPIAHKLMTNDWRVVVNDPEIHIVTELVGGTTVAREIILTALKLGKPVVTANKALISAHGEELFAAAKKYGANLYYEASVCGGIPIIKSLREGFVGNRINALYGIVNGTCNYILTRMKHEGADFAEVLADAQKLGYAETPPDLDIDGHDAAHKTGILASLAHGFWVNPSKSHVEGIRHISALDIKFAGELGYTIKLLGMVKKLESGCRVQVSVYPTLVPDAHVLASVNGVFNAVFVRGDIVGDSLVLRSRRGQGRHGQRRPERSGRRRARFEIRHQAPPAAVCAARMFRRGHAD